MTGARRFSAIGRDTRGNVLPLAAIGMLISLALVGGAIDMSRAYRAENRLQSACDAAVLAGRRAVGSNGFDQPAQDQANSYFTTNFDDTAQETNTTVFTPSTVDNGLTVSGTATTRLNPVVMKVFGFQRFNLSVNCSAAMGVGNSDVMMVLDTTGSMMSPLGTGTRISALQAAMKNFYTTVKASTAGTNARIRYGFVPYSTTVNVGRLLYAEDPSYLVDTWAIQSRQPIQNGATYTQDNNLTNGSYTNDTSFDWGSSSNCNRSLSAATAWVNNGSSSNLGIMNASSGTFGNQSWTTGTRQPQNRTMYECYQSGTKWYRRSYRQSKNLDTLTNWKLQYRQVSYDVSSYKAFNSVSTNIGNYGAAVSSTWNGCIEERGGQNQYNSFSYSSVSGISPNALDLDIDTAPSSTANSRWAPMWPEAAYLRLTNAGYLTNSATSDYGYDVNSYCPYRAQLLTEMSQSNFNTYADSLIAQGSTYLDIGLVWGGRLASPDGIFKDNVNVVPANGGEVSRHIIFMTDGIMEPNYSIQSAWGIEWHDRRVTSDGYSNDASRHTSRFRAICDTIKAKGIRIWTISFTAGGNPDLAYCASADSALSADDATELNTAFQEIAKQVAELRLTQ